MDQQPGPGDLDHIAEDLHPLAVHVSTLEALPGNPNLGDDEALANSLRGFKQRKNITVTKSTGHVSAGNTTLRAIQALGKEWVAAVFIDDDAEMQAAWAITDNRTRDLADTDDMAWAEMARQIEQQQLWEYATMDAADLTDLDSLLAETAPTTELDDASGIEGVTVNESLDQYTQAGLRQIIFQYTQEEYQGIVAAMAKAKKLLGAENNPELLAMLLEDWH